MTKPSREYSLLSIVAAVIGNRSKPSAALKRRKALDALIVHTRLIYAVQSLNDSSKSTRPHTCYEIPI